MKIKIELDGLTLDQATELTNFLSSLKPLEETKQTVQNFEVINPEKTPEKPKAARKKVEKPEPSFYDLSDKDAPKTNIDEAPVQEAPVQEAPVQEAPVQEAPVQEAPVQEAPVQEVKNIKVNDPEVVSPSALTLVILRTKVKDKIAEDRAFLNTIKAKLTELGAANVSTLKEAHYKAFNDFLTTL